MNKMEYITLLKANLKRHRGSLIGVFVLILIVSLSLAAVLTVWANSGSYVQEEMNRLGFGDITAWVSDVPEIETLTSEISALSEVEKVGRQNLIYSNYRIGGKESDSEGQLIVYDSESYPYKIFIDDLSGYREDAMTISPGEIYISPSISSAFNVGLGDEIHFPIARPSPRQGTAKAFVVKGFFEDPFMGSSMIGMKSFLISERDSVQIAQTVADSGIDALARTGSMLHIFGHSLGSAELSRLLNEQTPLPEYVEFVHSNDSIFGFMLILQNAFAGFLLAFVTVLTAVSMVVLGHSISSSIRQDYVNMGILKTIGFTSGKLRRIQLLQHLTPVLCGIAFGLLLSPWLISTVVGMMITTTGLLVPAALPVGLCALSFAAILCLLIVFICAKTVKIGRVAPMRAIRGDLEDTQMKALRLLPIRQKWLEGWLAIRQLTTGKRQYISALAVTILLVFFACLVGRMNSWLGADGAGLMDAFNPAEHDVAVQRLGDTNMEEIEGTIAAHTAITDKYQLAMPSVALNGVDYTANVITEPERFHILRGRTSANADEIVLTEFLAADLNADIGDTVTAAADKGSAEYVVAGIYQCANNMGANFGMSGDGYGRIAEGNPSIWCTHYFLEEPSHKQAIMQDLESTYGGDIHLHENAWPGLYGIISAMQALMVLMYAVVAVFILVVITLSGSKVLSTEQKDLGIYKALGFTSGCLRRSFALRFGIVSAVGAAIGAFLSAVVTDPLVAAVLRMCGISNFSSRPTMVTVLLPPTVVVGLFVGFAYLASGRIKSASLAALAGE